MRSMFQQFNMEAEVMNSKIIKLGSDNMAGVTDSSRPLLPFKVKENVANYMNRRSIICPRIPPLHDAQILRRIFKYLPVNSLKSVRLAGSHLWLKESLPSWRRQAILKLNMTPNSPPKEGVSISYLMCKFHRDEDYQNMKSISFKNYKLHNFHYINEQQGHIQFFLDMFSCRIRTLIISDSTFYNVAEMCDFLFLNFPNLTTLKFKGQVGFVDMYEGGLNFRTYSTHTKLKSFEMETTAQLLNSHQFPWLLFIERMCNLETLTLRLNYEDTHRENFEILYAACLCRSMHRPKMNLKNVEVYPVNVERKFDSIDNAKYVDIFDLIPSITSAPIFDLERFTGSVFYISHMIEYAETLQFLRLRLIDHRAPLDDRMYGVKKSNTRFKFPHLNELQLISRLYQAFVNIGKCDLPNLEKFSVEGGNDFKDLSREVEDVTKPIKNIVLTNLHEFQCYHMKCIFRKTEIEGLANSMPNLRKVVIPLSSKTFSTVCRVWPKLESITVLESEIIVAKGKEVDDEAITGIINSNQGEEREPNITDLKELRCFTLECDRGDARLTERSVNNGFLQVDSLRHLKIPVKHNKVSEKAILELREKLLSLEIHQKPSTGGPEPMGDDDSLDGWQNEDEEVDDSMYDWWLDMDD